MRIPFETLEVSDKADDKEIKQSYLKKVRQFPPDLFPEKFKEIVNAYNAIKTKKDRLRYELFTVIKPTAENFISILDVNETERFHVDMFLKVLSTYVKKDLKKILPELSTF